MLKVLTTVFFVAFLTGSCQAQTTSGLQRVVIIRHAEKPDNGDNLSCKGFNRSLALPPVLYSKFKLPDKIFVPAVGNGKSANQLRMFETITPFAVKYNLKIDSKFDVDDVKNLADAIMKTNGYVLVVWEHDKIDNIAKALGVDSKNVKWTDGDFDSIWIIDFKNGKGTLSFDKENIKPADACKF
jgi:hypothetical protein